MYIVISASFSFLKLQIISIIKEIMLIRRLCALPLVMYTPLEGHSNKYIDYDIFILYKVSKVRKFRMSHHPVRLLQQCTLIDFGKKFHPVLLFHPVLFLSGKSTLSYCITAFYIINHNKVMQLLQYP